MDVDLNVLTMLFADFGVSEFKLYRLALFDLDDGRFDAAPKRLLLIFF